MLREKAELSGYLNIIRDPRIERSKMHKLSEILFITVCAVLCECDTWEDLHDFSELREAWLK